MPQYVESFMIDFLVRQLLSSHALAHTHTMSWLFCNKGEHLSKLFWLISFPVANPEGHVLSITYQTVHSSKFSISGINIDKD